MYGQNSKTQDTRSQIKNLTLKLKVTFYNLLHTKLPGI